MPFHGVGCQLGVTAIEVGGFVAQFWLGGELAPGKREGQDYIHHNISGSSVAEKGWVCNPAARAEIKVACPITIGANH